jgi:hypothetical protein
MSSASCGRSVLNSRRKASKRSCCCRLLTPGAAPPLVRQERLQHLREQERPVRPPAARMETRRRRQGLPKEALETQRPAIPTIRPPATPITRRPANFPISGRAMVSAQEQRPAQIRPALRLRQARPAQTRRTPRLPAASASRRQRMNRTAMPRSIRRTTRPTGQWGRFAKIAENRSRDSVPCSAVYRTVRPGKE